MLIRPPAPHAGFLAWVERHLAAIYLVTQIPLIVFLSLARVPMGVPDEGSHIARAMQIADGEILSKLTKAGKVPGGRMDVDFAAFAHIVNDNRFLPLKELRPRLEPLAWSSKKQVAAFASSVYFPGAYVPQALVVAAGRALGLSIFDTLRFGSILLGCLWASLAALAVHLAPRGRRAIFVVLAFPMTVFEFASFAPDGALIASGALMAALVSATWSGDRLPRGVTIATILVAGIVLGATKLAYLPLVLSAFAAICLCRSADSFVRRASLVSAAATIAVAVGWYVVSKSGQVALSLDHAINSGQQLSFLLHNPGEIPRIVRSTLSAHFFEYVRMTVGVLGWLDAPIPRIAVAVLLVCLALAAFGDADEDRGRLSRGAVLTVLAGVLASAGAIFLALYLIWTNVGSLGPIEGVQGRYFLPILPFVFIVLPRIDAKGMAARNALLWPLVAVVVAQAATVEAILRRY